MSGQGIKSDVLNIAEVVQTLRRIAVHLLARMYLPGERLFAFRLRRNGQSDVLDGVSRRYTAIALIGLADEDAHIVRQVLGDHGLEDVCDRLLDDIDIIEDLGEVALTTWAARMIQHPRTSKAIELLGRLDPAKMIYPTVELSWALSALVISSSKITDMVIAKRIANELVSSFNRRTCFFPHAPKGKGLSLLRAHVSCFADMVYPIQALSHYYQATGDQRAIEIACCCAERMCQLQGPQGQWWWHYDVRTGRIIEHFPVYAVHQDSMAPMALFALADACGKNYSESIEKSIGWLINPPEISSSLIDIERKVIWRKVARREPHKLVRGLQATFSRLHPSVRLPGVDTIFPPVSIDYESRPYHMGWILHAWPDGQAT